MPTGSAMKGAAKTPSKIGRRLATDEAAQDRRVVRAVVDEHAYAARLRTEARAQARRDRA
ncbi:MAG: hypothetical protein U0235_08380 [Polyangiaceae bacterium]